MVTFGERIRALALKLGKDEKDIAAELGMSKSKMSHYINGRNKVPSELLQEIVSLYKKNPRFLFDEDAPLYISKEKTNRYHYLPTSISAGLPLDVEAITESETIQIPDTLMGKWAGDKEIFFSKINGDSMDRIIPDGSLIGIIPVEREALKNGDIVVFSDEYDYSVKYFYRTPDKLIFKPYSHNMQHHEQHFPIDDGVEIHGKVVLYIVELD